MWNSLVALPILVRSKQNTKISQSFLMVQLIGKRHKLVSRHKLAQAIMGLGI